MKVKRFIGLVWMMLLFNVGVITTCYAQEDKNQYKLIFEDKSETIQCFRNEEGKLLLPLNDVTALIRYKVEECGRCGKDEIYPESGEGDKGRININWYKNVITYSNDPTIIVLDSNTEKENGITYTSPMLYQYLDYTVQIDEDNNTVTVTEGTQQIDTIYYAYDPSCSSCEEVSALLDTIHKEKDVTIEKIDITANSEEQLQKLWNQCYVPDVLRNIYPMVFIEEQYLFDSEISEENIGKLLNKEAVEHSIDYGETEVPTTVTATGGTKVLAYFYSTTCASCKKAVDYLYELEQKYPDIRFVGYNIYEPENITLLKAYGRSYGLSKKKLGDIPAVFWSDSALVGDEDITSKLEYKLLNYDSNKPTIFLNTKTVQMKKDAVEALAVFGAGLLNGINPCSLSMFLFLLSILMAEPKKILKMSVSFCIGKFMMFFLLGTLLYKTVSMMNLTVVNVISKTLLIIFILALALLNVKDYRMAKKEQYDKMVLQLPGSLKHFNHFMIRKFSRHADSALIILLMGALGMILASGEFMCTGQIYLTAVLVLIQGSTFEWKAIGYLALYSFAFILPLLAVTFLVYGGNKVFKLSETLLERLPAIKLISSVAFVLFGIYVVFYL